MIASDRAADMQGRTIGHYKIVSAIGAGGMGEVYLATDTRHGRQVALKLLPDHLVKDPERVRRFQQEARAVLALNHPNIVTVYEIGQAEDGTQYIASELVKGQTLRARMAGAPLKLNQAIDIASQVSAALVEAHHEGVVHRDIKPENIMIRPDGYVKVLDFGIAKLSEGQTPSAQTEAPTLMKIQTRPGMVLGSAHYMSPEQARGLPVDERTDIWSLGVVLYEMIAGRVPFEGETPSDCIAAILDKEPPALTRFAPDVPEALEVIVTSALTKDRDERYHSVKEFLGALRRLKQRLDASAEIERSAAPDLHVASSPSSDAIVSSPSQSIPTTQPIHSTSSAEYIVSEIKRHKTGIAIAVALVAVLLVGGGFALYKILGAKSNVPPHAPKFTALTTGGRAADLLIDGLVTISPDGRYVTYAALDEHAQSALWVKQISTNNQVQLVPPAPCWYGGTTFSPDGEFVYYVRRLQDQINPTLYRVPVIGGEPVKVLDNVFSTVSFAPNGKRFVFMRYELVEREERQRLMLANTDGSGEPSVLTEVKPPQAFTDHTAPSWSPDGKLIAIALETWAGLVTDAVVGVSVADGRITPLTSQTWPAMGRVLWLPDGSGLVFTAWPSQNASAFQVWYLSYPEGKARRITNDLNRYGTVSLGITADGSTIATIQGSRTGAVWVLAPNEDESRAKQLTSGGTVDGHDSLSWLPDGRILYNSRAGDNADLWIMNADGTNRRQLTNDAYWEYNATASPDGRYIVFQSERGGNLNLWRIDADGNNPKQLTEGNGVDVPHAFSPDGQWVVFLSTRTGQATAWKVSINGGAAQQLTDERTYGPAVSPDGRLLSYGHLVEQPGAPPHPEFVIIPFDGGPPVKRIAAPDFAAAPLSNGGFQWTPDGRAVCFVGQRGNVPNLWALPLDGSPPRQLTNFKSEFIRNYAFSRDGRRLAVSRGLELSDIVLIKDFR
jgi:serine/threonine protein kinase